MRLYILLGTLLSTFILTTAFSQERDENRRFAPEAMEHEMQARRVHLQQEKNELDLEFYRKMKELEFENQKLELEKHKLDLKHHPTMRKNWKPEKLMPFFLICFVIHILVAIWIYQDIHKRNTGSGIWIVIGLLAGLFGALSFAVVRLGDIQESEK